MKKAFIASLCYQGAHGGGLWIFDECIVFKTGKLQLPENYRNISICYKDIDSVSAASAAIVFPAIVIKLKNGEVYKFIVFFRTKFLSLISTKNVHSN